MQRPAASVVEGYSIEIAGAEVSIVTKFCSFSNPLPATVNFGKYPNLAGDFFAVRQRASPKTSQDRWRLLLLEFLASYPPLQLIFFHCDGDRRREPTETLLTKGSLTEVEMDQFIVAR